MTHSLHRRGTEENLKNDFTMLAVTQKGINSVDSAEKKKIFLQIALRNNPVNAGAVASGNLVWNSAAKLLEEANDNDAMQVCFSSKTDVINVLKEIIKEDLGISIVIQGLQDEIENCLEEVGLQLHTVNHSLGVWGKTDLLPNEEILEITSMCGHGMVTPNLTKKCIEDVINGKTNVKEAAKLLAYTCNCGIFNVKRAETLLQRILDRSTSSS